MTKPNSVFADLAAANALKKSERLGTTTSSLRLKSLSRLCTQALAPVHMDPPLPDGGVDVKTSDRKRVAAGRALKKELKRSKDLEADSVGARQRTPLPPPPPPPSLTYLMQPTMRLNVF